MRACDGRYDAIEEEDMIDPTALQRIPIPCQRLGCHCPAAYVVIQGGRVAIELVTRHHGRNHFTVLTLGEVAAMVHTTEDPAIALKTP